MNSNGSPAHISFFKTIGFKLASIYLAIILLVLASGLYFSLTTAERNFERSLTTQFQTIISAEEGKIEQYLLTASGWARYLAGQLAHEQITLTETANQTNKMTKFIKKHSTIFFDESFIVLLSQDARVVYCSYECDFLDNSLLGIELVRHVAKTHQVKGAVVHDGNQFSLYSVSPVIKQQKHTGFIIVGKKLNGDFFSQNKSQGVDLAIVRDRALMATTHHIGDKKLVDLPMPYIEYLTILKQENMLFKTHFMGHDYYIAAKKIDLMSGGLSGSIMLMKSRHELDQIKLTLIKNFSYMGLFFTLLILFISISIARKLLLPIYHLALTSSEIANGKKGTKAKITSQDEFGMLAQNFNHMLDTIDEKNSIIQDQNETLERQVLHRTEELHNTMEELSMLTVAVEQSPVSILITNTEGVIEYVNSAFERVTGYSKEESIGHTPAIIKSEHTNPAIYSELWETIKTGQNWKGELYNRSKDGRLYWERVTIVPIRNEQNIITHFLGLKEDITSHKEYQNKLIKQANYDILTGLPNRFLAEDRLNHSLSAVERNQTKGALLFIDLDDFKKVNDTLGHHTGDLLLKEVAKLIQRSIRDEDTVSRLGGDEFLVILQNINNNLDAEIVAEKIITILSQGISIDEHQLFVSSSIGITVFPDDDTNAVNLMRNADAAMYQAKNKGKNTFQFFSAKLNEQALKRLQLENLLRPAIEQQELYLHYQPLINAQSSTVSGVEALVRWNNPQLGNVPPDQFIPLAEETGLIFSIGEFVLRSACKQAKHWLNQGHHLTIAVNISTYQLRQPEQLLQLVNQVLNETGLPAKNLELELTESALIESPQQSSALLQKIKAMGIRLSIDDFGTGYSSLSYLKQYPFDTLKLDRSFVEDLSTHPQSRALAKSIINMAHDLEMKVVGEGVETKEQFDYLKTHHCDLIQGYYCSKPLPVEQLLKELPLITSRLV